VNIGPELTGIKFLLDGGYLPSRIGLDLH